MCFFAVQAEVPSSEFNSSQDSEWHSDTSSAMSSYLRQFQVVETIDKSQPDVWEHHEISRNNSCVNKCRVQIFDATYATLPETKVALESQWLDDSFPFGKAYSQVLSSFQGVVIMTSQVGNLDSFVSTSYRGLKRSAPCDFGSFWCWEFLKRILDPSG